MLLAALFDLDGTLIDSLADLAGSMNEALGEMGLPTHDLEAYRYFIGDGVASLIDRALPAGRRDPQTVGRVAELYRAAYGRNWHQQTRPYAGIVELLAALAADGVPLAVLSNKPQAFTEWCVQHFFPDHTFTHVFGQREGVPHKPDPAGALEIAQELQLAPASVGFIGDTATDMRTAVAAGMFALGVSWGFRPVQELVENGAREIVGHPEELRPFFRKSLDRNSIFSQNSAKFPTR